MARSVCSLLISIHVVVVGFIAGGNPTLAATNEAVVNASYFSDTVRPFFDRHCFECHSGEEPKGDLNLDKLSPDFFERTGRQHWQTVLEKLVEGAMPPKKKPRPPENDVKALSAWITEQAKTADVLRRATQGRVVWRRLNRVEYENTVRDLLGVNIKLKEMLPLDTPANGFDNVGDALHTSSFLLERYLEAANVALNEAIANRPLRPPSTKKRYSLQDANAVKSTTEPVFRKLEDGSLVFLCSSEWQGVNLNQFYSNERGRYRFRISASAIRNAGQPVTFRVTGGGGRSSSVNYFDAPSDTPAVFEFVQVMEPQTSITILPYGLPTAHTIKHQNQDTYAGPALVVQWVEVEGPLNDTWPPESHRRIFGNLPQTSSPTYSQPDRVEVVSRTPLADAGRLLRAFMRRAFRREVTDDDVKPFLTLVVNKLRDRHSFEQAMRVGLLAVMTSPKFLFLDEKPGRLDDYALASRLSYFLWSTMPDEELLTLAAQKKLNQPEVLHAQVERLLKDPKATAFAENFVGQWLGLRDIDFTMPNHILYPDYDDMLKISMVREAELFFSEVLANDLSLLNFVASDFSMLNGRLAQHYGIPGVTGWAFQKTSLPPESHRGGLLTMAAVLKVTANGTATSPVLRGAWVLDRILGTPPPPPPNDISPLEPDTRGATTVRQQLAKHRELPACASCHARIDPPGFALENFDVIGGWRENYRSSGNGTPVVLNGERMAYLCGPKVDAADVLPDGRKFQNVDELKQLLLADKEQIARALTVRLVTYATGGPPESMDQPRIDAIVNAVRGKNYGLRSLIQEIVQSDLFCEK